MNKKHETTITESLNEFLNDRIQPKYIKKAVVDYLLTKSNKQLSYDIFKSFKDQGRYPGNETLKKPDFVWIGDNSLVFVEVKIDNTGLTDAQIGTKKDKDSYLQMLENAPEGNKDLIFLIPSWYSHKNDIPATAKIIYWKDLIKFIQDEQYDNPVLNHIFNMVGDLQCDDIASNNDMLKIPFQFRESLEWINRITNRLNKIVKDSIMWNLLKNPREFSWLTKSDTIIKDTLVIYSGVSFDKDNWISIDWVENINNLVIHVHSKEGRIKINAKEWENSAILTKNDGTKAYSIAGVTVDSPVDDIIAVINKMFGEK